MRLIASLVGLILVSCSNPGTRVRPQPVVGQVAATYDEPDGLGREGRAALAREDMLVAFRADPAGAVRQLYSRWAGDFTEARRSEKMVRASHVSITHDPEAIEELRRILYLHAGLRYPAPNRR